MLFAYDGASRLTQATKTADPALANNSVAAPGDFAKLADAFAYAYDPAQNLLSTTKKENGIPDAVALPLDGSKRNRPGSVGSEALTWDANGNLLSKGDLRFQYDYRNRLTRVSHANGDEVATYEYDTFNRRLKKTIGTDTYETAWHGWQPVEEYRNSQLDQRRVYGLGLDEIVQVQTGFNGGSQPGQVYAPVYDSTGNLAVMTGNGGKPIERYEYTPYGARKIFVGTITPAVEQVRVKGGAVWVELSEGVSPDALAKALTDQTLKLTDLTHQQDLRISAVQPVTTGQEADRRLVITLTDSPAPQTQIRLTLPAAALVDSFLNQPAQDFQVTFAWPESDAVVQDSKPIQLERVAVHDGYLEIELSEEPDLATITAILVDGATATWTLGDDHYTLKSATILAQGSHTFSIGTTLADLNGGALAQAFTTSLSVVDKDNKSLFEAVNPRETQASTIGNLFGFQGLPVDTETGLIYFRNRYYDSEMGRFVSVDPKGYVDGPSLYTFEVDDPENGSDPMGACNKSESLWDCTKRAAKDTGKTAVEFGAGVAQGIAGSITWNYLPGAQPKDTDTKARRIGQAVGNAIEFLGTVDATAGGAALTGVSCAAAVGSLGLLAPACVGAAAATAGVAVLGVGGAITYSNALKEKVQLAGNLNGQNKLSKARSLLSRNYLRELLRRRVTLRLFITLKVTTTFQVTCM